MGGRPTGWRSASMSGTVFARFTSRCRLGNGRARRSVPNATAHRSRDLTPFSSARDAIAAPSCRRFHRCDAAPPPTPAPPPWSHQPLGVLAARGTGTHPHQRLRLYEGSHEAGRRGSVGRRVRPWPRDAQSSKRSRLPSGSGVSDVSAGAETMSTCRIERNPDGIPVRVSFPCGWGDGPLGFHEGGKPRRCSVPIVQGTNAPQGFWNWDGNVEGPTITPSINCIRDPATPEGWGGCGWHKNIVKGEPT